MIGLGDIVERIIRIITFGQGKRFATWIAKLFGYADCGCDKRQEKLNKFQIKIKR
jgi:hypothetical protein|tara:strand:+ start:317 stop:481 length:165 start_codon:yes stop_codon:yes gene_type:complete